MSPATAAAAQRLVDPPSPTTVSVVKKPKRKQQQQQPGLVAELLTAGTAACVADLFTFPLDTAKVRLQVGNQDKYILALT